MMKQVLLALFQILRRIRWFYEAKIIRHKISVKNLCNIKNERILVLMPHSDDEWIGCGMLLSKYAKNAMVVNMDMPGGDDYKLHGMRLQEALTMSKQVGYSFTTISNDIGLDGIISSYHPTIIFTPSFIDWHDEHIAVIRTLMSSINTIGYCGKIGMYQVSVPIPPSFINYGIEMSKKELRKKWDKLLATYRSQAFLPVYRFMMNEHINGAISNTYSLEAFSIMEASEWLEKTNSRGLSENGKNFVKDNLNNLKVIHNWRVLK